MGLFLHKDDECSRPCSPARFISAKFLIMSCAATEASALCSYSESILLSAGRALWDVVHPLVGSTVDPYLQWESIDDIGPIAPEWCVGEPIPPKQRAITSDSPRPRRRRNSMLSFIKWNAENMSRSRRFRSHSEQWSSRTPRHTSFTDYALSRAYMSPARSMATQKPSLWDWFSKHEAISRRSSGASTRRASNASSTSSSEAATSPAAVSAVLQVIRSFTFFGSPRVHAQWLALTQVVQTPWGQPKEVETGTSSNETPLPRILV